MDEKLKHIYRYILRDLSKNHTPRSFLGTMNRMGERLESKYLETRDFLNRYINGTSGNKIYKRERFERP